MTREDYYWLNEDSIKFLERGYLKEGQTALERIVEISNTAEKILNIKGFSRKFQGYMAKGYYSLATPVWMNFGNKRGNPISCFNSYIDDSVEDFLIKQAEVGMMTKVGEELPVILGIFAPVVTRFQRVVLQRVLFVVWNCLTLLQVLLVRVAHVGEVSQHISQLITTILMNS